MPITAEQARAELRRRAAQRELGNRTETFDDLPEKDKDFFRSMDADESRVNNALSYSRTFGMDPGEAYEREPELNQAVFNVDKLPAQPGKMLFDSIKQGMKYPAAFIRGTEVFTQGRGTGIDPLLDRASTMLQSLNDPLLEQKLQAVRSGKLWPVGDDKRWWQVERKYLPEVINAWAANVGDQIPLVLTVMAGRYAGKIIGKPIGAAAGVLAALGTGGPDPSDVVTAPAVAATTQAVMGHLGGAGVLVGSEAANFMDDARSFGIDMDIAEKYARQYAPLSGVVEYAEWLFVLGRYSKIAKGVQTKIVSEGLKLLGGSVVSGMEEVSQQGLENWLLQKAAGEMRLRHPDWDVEVPTITEGWVRSGVIGAGTRFALGAPGTGMTIAAGRMARKAQVKPETKKFLGEPSYQEMQAAEEEAQAQRHLKEIAGEAVSVEKPPEVEPEPELTEEIEEIEIAQGVQFVPPLVETVVEGAVQPPAAGVAAAKAGPGAETPVSELIFRGVHPTEKLSAKTRHRWWTTIPDYAVQYASGQETGQPVKGGKILIARKSDIPESYIQGEAEVRGVSAEEMRERINKMGAMEIALAPLDEAENIKPFLEVDAEKFQQAIKEGKVKNLQDIMNLAKAGTGAESEALTKARSKARQKQTAYFVHEREPGRYSVTTRPPREGRYLQVNPPVAGQAEQPVIEGVAGKTPQEIESTKALVRQVHGIKNQKGLTTKEYKALKRKVTQSGQAKSSARMTVEELQKLVAMMKRVRPKRIGYKKVITRKTENKIESLRQTYMRAGQMSDAAFAEVLQKEVYGRKPTYIDAKNFITEQEGQDIIRRLQDKAEELGITEPLRRAVEGNDDIRKEWLRLQNVIDGKKHRDPSGWESMRYYFAQMQKKTKLPFYDVYLDLVNTKHASDVNRHRFWDELHNSVENMQAIISDPDATKRIGDYFASQTKLEDRPPYPKDITADELKIARRIEEEFRRKQLPARLARFMNWYDMGMPETGPDALPQYDQFKKEINKAVDIYQSQGKETLLIYLATQKWGVKQSGYDPMETVIHKIMLYTPRPTTVGKGHIRVQNAIEYMTQERNIFQRLDSYWRQMDILTELYPKIKVLIRMTEDNVEAFNNPQDIIKDVEAFIKKLKRFNDEGGRIERFIARAYAQAARARIMLSPRLVLLNLTEATAFETDKSILIDPRNQPLAPEDLKDFETHVNQVESMMNEYFMLREKPFKGLRWLSKMAERVSLTPWADRTSRMMSYRGKINQVRRALNHPDISRMADAAKLGDFDEVEQKMALAILAKEGPDAFARYVSRIHTDAVHFLYERMERSPVEITGERIWTNLMLFTRAYAERLTRSTYKVLERGAPLQQRIRHAKVLVSIIGGGMLVGALYCALTRTKRNPYSPLDIMAYKLGGLELGAIQLLNDVYRDTLRAFNGDEKAWAPLIMNLPKLPDTFVPFWVYLVRGVESLEGKKNIDRETVRRIREVFDEDYHRRPEAYQIDRDFTEALAHLIEGKQVDWTIEERKKEQGEFKIKLK